MSALGPVVCGACMQPRRFMVGCVSKALRPLSVCTRPHSVAPGSWYLQPLFLSGWATRRIDVKTRAASSDAVTKKKLVFLGTPQVAADVLQMVLEDSRKPSSAYEPGKMKGRGKKRCAEPSPVHQLARQQGVPEDQILVPESAKDARFLQQLQDLAPDLCVTAAYGNFLPKSFLDIPRHGTLNIHPSLLPLYRGAAPVPRSLEAGDQETGVTLAYTVLKMDAGPVLGQDRMEVPDSATAPEMLQVLFRRGAVLLLQHLDAVWDGTAPGMAVPQDASAATKAPKMAVEDGVLDFSLPAQTLHNKVRAFVPWPGTRASFTLAGPDGEEEEVEMKLSQSRVCAADRLQGCSPGQVVVGPDSLVIPCGGGTALEILEVQPVGKKAMPVKAYRNGLGKRRLMIAPRAAPTAN